MRAAETWRVFATLGGMSTVAVLLFAWGMFGSHDRHPDH